MSERMDFTSPADNRTAGDLLGTGSTPPASAPDRRRRAMRCFSVGCLTGFTVVTIVVIVDRRPAVDVTVTGWVGSRQDPGLIDALNVVRLMVSQLPLVIAPGLGLFLCLGCRRRDGMLVVGSVWVALLVSVVAKVAIARDRPDPDLLLVPTNNTDWSFPSSSVAVAVVFWGLVALDGQLRTVGIRRLARTLAFVAVVAIGPSRIYTGEHWLTDVIAGYLLGAAILLATVPLLESQRDHHQQSPHI